ncbi:TetR/AcrR family transcriptional regulator [Streptomyces monashensis]|uniref:TetR family transcriptional regulator n=1 Tax=Streptomyces monashensis TaxID=1678012 RepID=A0A1S2QDI7_9ACTN|nr:TetR/AcrR family transcriptional regulator [Streptomyces monashensis]OIK03763.1 TetR family transcriptional regulator [Streptomyces monashensis]
MGDRPPVGRRDALRNRKLLTDKAREVFAEQGLDAPLDDIARRAGVGNATLYRHFPNRAALVDEVFRDALTETTAAGDRARTAEDAWTGLTEYLRTVFAGLAADRGTNDLMTTHLEGVTSLEAIHAHNRTTIDGLIRRGQEQGTIRPDVTTEDLLFALAALGRAVPALTTVAPDAWSRPLALLLDGLRARPAAPPLPTPALTSDHLGTVLLNLGPHRRR